MQIDPERYYPSDDPALDPIGSRQTRAKYRCEGVGPPYYKVGNRVFYLGGDVIDWLAERRVQTRGA